MIYVGSKANIAADIVGFIHSYLLINNYKNYVEPFVGGANIIDKVTAENKMAFDKNKYIIALFKYLQDGGELPDEITREQYNDCKAHFQAKDKYCEDWYTAAVGFLTSFSGGFFAGYANSIDGKDYYSERKENVIEQMRSLHDVKFSVSDYKDLKPVNSVVYCDPPSGNTNREFDHKEFWDTVRKWSKNNIVLVSYTEAPDDFDVIWEKDTQDLSDIDNEHKKATEKLFIHHSLNKETEFDF